VIESGTPAFWRATLALCLGSFLIFCNLYTTQPLLPLFSSDFGVSPLLSSLSLSVSTLTLGASLLIYGPLSDALGRTRIMQVTMGLSVVCGVLLAMAPGFWFLLVVRALQGVCLGGLPAIAVAYMGDEFERPAMTMAVGFYIAANSLGGISGRLISGLVAEHWGWHASFLTVAGLSVACLAAFVRLLPPSRTFTRRPLRLRHMAADLGGHLVNPTLVPAFLIGGLNFFVFVNQYSFITYRLSAPPYGLSPGWLGMLFLTYLSGTAGSAISGHILRRFSAPATMALGIVTLMIGTCVTLGDSLAVIVLGLLLNAFGFFLTHSTASGWVAQQAGRARASASSIYLLCYYLGASVGSFYFAPFWSRGGWPGVVVGSLLVFAVTLGLSFRLRTRHGAGRYAAADAL